MALTYQCEVCARSGADIAPGVGPNGVGYVAYRTDLPGVALCKCARCYEDDATRASHPVQQKPKTMFDVWADLNEVICPCRARFDALRKQMPQCASVEQIAGLVRREGYGERYPLLPDSLEFNPWH